jgi:hypothetical protein
VNRRAVAGPFANHFRSFAWCPRNTGTDAELHRGCRTTGRNCQFTGFGRVSGINSGGAVRQSSQPAKYCLFFRANVLKMTGSAIIPQWPATRTPKVAFLGMFRKCHLAISSVFCATNSGAELMHLARCLLHSGYCVWFNMLTAPIPLRRQRSSLAPCHRPKSGAIQRVTRPATPIPPIPQPASELFPARQLQ